VIVDSSVMIDFVDGRRNAETEWLGRHLSSEQMGITSLILSEVLQGIRGDKRFAETAEALQQFALFEVFSSKLAIASAQNYRRLRGLGITIRNTIDCLNATFCIEDGHQLLHRDSDFDHFAAHLNLLVVDPSIKTLN